MISEPCRLSSSRIVARAAAGVKGNYGLRCAFPHTQKDTVVMTEPLLVDAREAARLLGISRATLYVTFNRDPGFPRPVKIGRAVRWRIADLRSWVEHQPTTATGAEVVVEGQR